MKYLEAYLNELKAKGKAEIADSVEKTADKFYNDHLKVFSFAERKDGLLFGRVQSGKTGQMLGIMCAAAYAGFGFFIILTTDNTALQEQTLKRVNRDISSCGITVCGEREIEKFLDCGISSPAVAVLKKNAGVLKQWSNALNSADNIAGNGLFIFDDEGDAASLNGAVNKNKITTINERIESMRRSSVASFYLQVTGTPQAVILQTEKSDFRPSFVCSFEPGGRYLGGDFFFTEKGKYTMRFLDGSGDDEGDDIYNAVVHHLAASAQIFLTSGKVCTFMLHPGVKRSSHSEIKKKIVNALSLCRSGMSDGSLESAVLKEYDSMAPVYSVKKPFEDLYKEVCRILSAPDGCRIFVMNSTSIKVSEEDYQAGSNIIIGGNTLGRGVTFPQLQTVYYTRTAKKPQADTMWQHSRMFGYDRDPGIMAVYITEHLYKLFSDINTADESIIKQIEHGYDKIHISYPEGINPTRSAVLDQSALGIIVGGANYYPNDPDNDDVDALSNILNKFKNKKFQRVSTRLIISLLQHIIPSDDFKEESFIGALNAELSKNPASQSILIVRMDRKITQGTGSLLSPDDRALGDSFGDVPVLTMYEVTGSGWKRSRLWVPNIKLPDGVNYYDIS